MRLGLVLWLVVGVAAGQQPVGGQPGIDGPPVCPVAGGAKAAPKAVAARPSAEAAKATAEREAANPDVLVAAEPIANFGVERYRLQDYGDCVGSEGCYWKDLDAQFQRAEFALSADLAKHA